MLLIGGATSLALTYLVTPYFYQLAVLGDSLDHAVVTNKVSKVCMLLVFTSWRYDGQKQNRLQCLASSLASTPDALFPNTGLGAKGNWKSISRDCVLVLGGCGLLKFLEYH